MRTNTRLEYEQRLEYAVRLIADSLDDPLGLQDLADRVGFSRFHFHRVFQALLGETVGGITRRLLLERAATQLRCSDTPITEIAFSAGYATHEAFVKAFRAAFGYTPSGFRRHLRYAGELPTVNGVHYRGGTEFAIRFIASRGESVMQVDIKEVPARRAVCFQHHGPYYMIGQSFGALQAWVEETQAEVGKRVGIFYDDPEATAPDKLRSDAGAYVAPEFHVDDPRVHIVDLPAGSYAVHTHFGPYDGLSAAWAKLGSDWFPNSGYDIGTAPAFEVYVNDCTAVPVDQIQTELYFSIKTA